MAWHTQPAPWQTLAPYNASPFGKLDLGDQHGFNPMAAFQDRRGNPKSPSASAFLRQVDKGTSGTPQLL
jgi:hypothetical protein